MIKNNRGITMIMLVVTIIVLLILTGVSINTSETFMTDIRASRIISNMELVKSKAENIYEANQFDSENNSLIGTTVTLSTSIISSEENKLIKDKTGKNISELVWYRWDRNTLTSLGLDEKMLDSAEDYFYVNYENSEVVCSSGTKFDGVTYYSMIGLKYMLKNK